ncbi:MAG: hypothetical protein R3B06_28880 [Kofleriaceae bacterium]
MDRWPRGSRSGRQRRAWLRDSRGRTYRLGPTVAFHVYFQPCEGKLWSRLYRDGVPLRIPALASREEFLAEVGNAPGAYQLQPIDVNAKQSGDPPAMVFVPSPEATAAPLATPAPAPPPADEADDVGEHAAPE